MFISVYILCKSDKAKKQVSSIWLIIVTVSKGVYEYFLAIPCLNWSCELVRLFTNMLQYLVYFKKVSQYDRNIKNSVNLLLEITKSKQ